MRSVASAISPWSRRMTTTALGLAALTGPHAHAGEGSGGGGSPVRPCPILIHINRSCMGR